MEKKKRYKSSNLNALHKPDKSKKSTSNVSARRSLTVLGKKPATRAAAPKPINVPSVKKENGGRDISVKLVGEGGWGSTTEDAKTETESESVVVPSSPPSAPQSVPTSSKWDASSGSPNKNKPIRTGKWGDDAMNEEESQYPGLGQTSESTTSPTSSPRQHASAAPSSYERSSSAYDRSPQRRPMHSQRDRDYQRGSSHQPNQYRENSGGRREPYRSNTHERGSPRDTRNTRDTRDTRDMRDTRRSGYDTRGYGEDNGRSLYRDQRSDSRSRGRSGSGDNSRHAGGNSSYNEYSRGNQYSNAPRYSSTNTNTNTTNDGHWADRGSSRYDDGSGSNSSNRSAAYKGRQEVNSEESNGLTEGNNNTNDLNEEKEEDPSSSTQPMTDGQNHGVVAADLSSSPIRLAQRNYGRDSNDNQDQRSFSQQSTATVFAESTNGIIGIVRPIIPEYESRRAPVIFDSDEAEVSGPKKLFDPTSGKMVEIKSNTQQSKASSQRLGGGRGRGRRDGQQEQEKQQPRHHTTPTSLATSNPTTTSTGAATTDSNGQPMSKLMEKLQRNRSEKERRQHEERDRHQQQRVGRRKKRQEERARRGPRTCGVKFTGDANSGYVNVDAWDVSSQANVTLQQILAASSSDSTTRSINNSTSNVNNVNNVNNSNNVSTNATTLTNTPTNAAAAATTTTATTTTSTNSNGSELLSVGTASSSVWGQQGTSSSSNTWEIGKPTSPGSNSSPISGTATSSNPYAAAFATSLQQPFVRANNNTSSDDPSDGTSNTVGNSSLEREESNKRQAALYATFMNTSTNPTNGNVVPSNGDTDNSQWGQSAGGVNPSAMEYVPTATESPTMSPQFSAMKPADNAEFNVVSFSTMGGAYNNDMASGSRSLLMQQQNNRQQQQQQHQQQQAFQNQFLQSNSNQQTSTGRGNSNSNTNNNSNSNSNNNSNNNSNGNGNGKKSNKKYRGRKGSNRGGKGKTKGNTKPKVGPNGRKRQNNPEKNKQQKARKPK